MVLTGEQGEKEDVAMPPERLTTGTRRRNMGRYTSIVV
jgi:hypothetical protein